MKKLENFKHAYNNLLDINLYHEPYDNVVLTGLVGLYEICFEQSWKAMKEILEEQGFAREKTGSPRLVLKTAYAAGMIHDEILWLEALAARNNVAHSYNRAVALDIVNQTRNKFLEMFQKLIIELEMNWVVENI